MKVEYTFNGPISLFDRPMGYHKLKTQAESDAEAKRNLLHQAMILLNRTNHGGIKLHGDIKKG